MFLSLISFDYFPLAGGFSPYGLCFQGAPSTASHTGSLLLLCTFSIPKERERGWTSGERSWALQSTRCTGLRWLVDWEDLEKWYKGKLRCRAICSDSSFQYISRKLYHSASSHMFEISWFVVLSTGRLSGQKVWTAEPCCETVGYLKIHRCLRTAECSYATTVSVCSCWY